MALPQRQLGSLTVSAFGYGCMGLSHAYDTAPEIEHSKKVLNRALDLGVTMLDTAALYGFGKNEELLGEAVMHRRDEFTLASKCVLCEIDGKRGINGTPEAIAQTIEGSLARLKTDFIDLMYLHRLDANVPIEDSMGALVKAKEEGKVGAFGVSEMSAETIRKAHAVHPLSSVQSEYSPLVLNSEIAVLDTCEELGIGFVAFSPTARGLLANSIHDDNYVEGDIRAAMPRFTEPLLSHNLKAVAKFNALAAELGHTPAQLSLAWVMARRPFIVPIAGTRSFKHLEENIAATEIRLSEESVLEIEKIFSGDAIKGPRYAAGPQSQIDTETFPDEELAEA
jgi:hypothetical protein